MSGISGATEVITCPKAENRWTVFALCAISYFLVYFHRVCPAVIAGDLRAEFGVTAAALGILSSAYFYVYASLQIPVGILTDRLGPKTVVLASLCIAAVGAFLFGASHSYAMAIAARTITGIGVAGIYIPSLRLLSVKFPRNEFAMVTGFMLAAGNLGAVSATGPLALAAQHLGWRSSFALIGITTLIVALATWWLVDQAPKAKPSSTKNKEEGRPWAIWGLLTLGAIMFFKYGPMMGYQGLWGAPYLIEVYGMSRVQAGGVLMWVSIGYIVGGPLTGYLADGVGLGRRFLLILTSALYASTFIPIALTPASIPWLGLYVMSFAMGVMSAASGVVVFAMSRDYAGDRAAGTGMAIVNAHAFVGSAAYQVAMGYVIDRAALNAVAPVVAFGSAFRLCLAGGVLMTLGSLLLRERKPATAQCN